MSSELKKMDELMDSKRAIRVFRTQTDLAVLE